MHLPPLWAWEMSGVRVSREDSAGERSLFRSPLPLWERVRVRGETCRLRTRHFAERVCTTPPHPRPLHEGRGSRSHVYVRPLGFASLPLTPTLSQRAEGAMLIMSDLLEIFCLECGYDLRGLES